MINYSLSIYNILFSLLMVCINQSILSAYTDSSLTNFSTGFLDYLNQYDKFSGKIIKLADNVELNVENVTTAVSSETIKTNPSAKTIEYNNFNVTLIFDINLSMFPPSSNVDPLGRGVILIKDKKLTFHLSFPRFLLTQRFDNSFDYDSFSLYSFLERNLGKLEDYEFFREIIINFDEYFFDDELVAIWYELIDQILVTYPQCDALYIYEKSTKLLIDLGYQEVDCEDPNFTRIKFLGFSYDSIETIQPFARRIKRLKIKVDYTWDFEYGGEVLFEQAIVTRNEIIFGEMSPKKEILEKNVIFFMRQAVRQIVDEKK